MELEDFFYTYPDVKDPNLQSILSRKLEFLELRSDTEKKTPEGYFYHQEIVRRYMSKYDRLLLIWEAGAGKTHGVLGPAELYRKYYNIIKIYQPSFPESWFNPINKYIKRTIIIVKNKQVKKIFRDTILSIASDLNTKSDIKHDGFYQMYTINEFYNWVSVLIPGIDTNEKITTLQTLLIRAEFDNTYFIIDEGHVFNPKIEKIIKDKKYSYTKVYNTILKVLSIKKIKVAISTATPMIDSVHEISYLMNLLLKPGDKMPIKKSDYVESKNDISFNLKIDSNTLSKYFNGLVSYAKVFYPGVDIVSIGEPLSVALDYDDVIKGEYFEKRLSKPVNYDILGLLVDNNESIEIEFPENDTFLHTSLIVEKCIMSGDQLIAYTKDQLSYTKNNLLDYAEIELEKDGKDPNTYTDDELIKYAKDEMPYAKDQLKREKIESLYFNARKIRNFVFPRRDNKNIYSTSGIRSELRLGEYLERDGRMISFTKFFIKKWIQTEKYGGIQSLSCVYARILDIIDKHIKNKDPGVIYIFFELIESGSQILDALVRAKFKYSRYIYSSKGKPIKKNQIAYLTGKTTNIKETLDQISRPENWNGDYVRIIIASGAISESYSIFNITKIIEAEMKWNFARGYQGINRGKRKGGFDALIANRLNPNKKVRVEIYRMCALLPSKIVLDPDELDSDEQIKFDPDSIDTARYFTSLRKEWKIRKMATILRGSAIDCQLKISDEEKPKDPTILDFDLKIKCQINNITTIDRSTYDLFYNDLKYENVKELVITVLKEHNIISTDALLDKVEVITQNRKLAIIILSKIIDQEIMIRDRYGFIKYIYERNGHIFISNYEEYNNAIYSLDLNFSYKRRLWDYFEDKIRLEVANKIKEMSYDEYKDYYNDSDIITKTTIVEQAIIDFISGNITKGEKWILDKVNNYYLLMKQPIGKIVNTRARMYDSKHRGARPSAGYWLLDKKGVDWEKIRKINEPIGPPVYIHYIMISWAAAAVVSSGLERFENRIRILESPYTEWRTINPSANPVEQETYVHILVDQLNKWRSEFISTIDNRYFSSDKYLDQPLSEENLDPVYLTKNPFNGKIRIVAPEWFRQKYTKKKISTVKTSDKRKKASGRELKNFSESDLRIIYLYFYPKKVLSLEEYHLAIINKINELKLKNFNKYDLKTIYSYFEVSIKELTIEEYRLAIINRISELKYFNINKLRLLYLYFYSETTTLGPGGYRLAIIDKMSQLELHTWMYN